MEDPNEIPDEEQDELEVDDRGFVVYGTIIDTKGSEVLVKESSAIGRPCCWIFASSDIPGYDNPSPHLSVDNAEALIQELQKFIDHAGSPDNWRNDEDYIETFG